MQILLKLFPLLINLSQETVLDFFGIDDPNLYLNMGLDDPISTEISLETLKLLFQGFIEHYQYGLGLIDIENILLFITFLRFIILTNRYNIRTSFYISCISLFAGFLWYSHLKDLYNWYGEMLTFNRITSRFGQDTLAENYISASKQHSQMYYEFLNQNPIQFLKNTFINASEKDGYRIDPISMLVARVPEAYKIQAEKGYYYFYGSVFPQVSRIIGTQLREIGPLMAYVWIVRIGKQYCPYLIRWHWTYIVVSTMFEGESIRVLYRLYNYYSQVLVPQGRFDEANIVEQFFAVFVTMHFFLVCLGMLHAVCGQYFYVPFVTENTEIHIGKRPQNSIYSGGYTSWQEGGIKQVEIMTKDRKLFIFPRIWWGWLGRSKTSRTEQEYRSREQNRFRKRRKKGFKKLIRKLKRWILRN